MSDLETLARLMSRFEPASELYAEALKQGGWPLGQKIWRLRAIGYMLNSLEKRVYDDV